MNHEEQKLMMDNMASLENRIIDLENNINVLFDVAHGQQHEMNQMVEKHGFYSPSRILDRVKKAVKPDPAHVVRKRLHKAKDIVSNGATVATLATIAAPIYVWEKAYDGGKAVAGWAGRLAKHTKGAFTKDNRELNPAELYLATTIATELADRARDHFTWWKFGDFLVEAGKMGASVPVAEAAAIMAEKRFLSNEVREPLPEGKVCDCCEDGVVNPATLVCSGCGYQEWPVQA